MKKKLFFSLIILLSISFLLSNSEINLEEFTPENILYINKISLQNQLKHNKLSISSTKLKKQLNLKQNPFYKKLLFWQKKPLFDINLALQDKENLIRYYQSNGFLYAEVKATIKQIKKNEIILSYYIKENSPIKITNSSIIIEDSTSISIPEKINKKKNITHQDKVKSRPNSIFKDSNIYYDQELINSNLINSGFLKAKTTYHIDLPDSLTVDLKFNVYPNELFYIKDLGIKGLRHTSEKTIKKVLSINDSLIYGSKLINKNQNDLIRLGIFRSVQIYPQFTDSKNFVKPTINLVEKAKWTIQTGIGWGQVEKFRTLLQLSHHNLLKTADQQDISFRSTAIEPINLQLVWTQPAFIGRSLKLSLSPFFKREKEDNFTLDMYGNATSLSYKLPINYWTMSFSHLLEQNKLKNIKIINDQDSRNIYNQSTVYTQLDINYSTPKDYPIKGIHLIAGGGIAGVGFRSPYDYILLQNEIRYYQPGFWLFNYAIRIAVNAMKEINNAPAIPFEKRLYLGGMQSIKGFNRNTISPYNESQQAIGGRSSLLLNFETRFPILKNFNGAILFDSGQVWNEAFHFQNNDLLYSLGLGLRYVTPIGIIRADFAKPFINSSGNIKFYLTIGEAF
jgi:outer membrane protein assembly complex protein YaeT